jgi:hypothetical protein
MWITGSVLISDVNGLDMQFKTMYSPKRKFQQYFPFMNKKGERKVEFLEIYSLVFNLPHKLFNYL